MVYCTPLAVKFLSQIRYTQLEFNDDGDYEAFVQDLVIPQAQKIIDSYCNHDFNNNSGTITLDGTGKDHVIIPPEYCPLQSVTSVTIDGGSSVHGDCKVYDQHIVYDGGTFTKDPQNVVIIASYGYSEVPVDIEFVCASVVANMLREMIRSKTMPDLIVPLMEAEGARSLGAILSSPRIFTRELKEMLQKYVFHQIEVG